MILNFWTDRSGQTVQSDQGLHCLLFHLHHLKVLHHGKTFQLKLLECLQYS